MQCATALASPRLIIHVESLKKGRQIDLDVVDRRLNTMDQLLAFETKPFKGIQHAANPWRFDDQPDGTGERTLW